jgi:hypothetical protein
MTSSKPKTMSAATRRAVLVWPRPSTRMTLYCRFRSMLSIGAKSWSDQEANRGPIGFSRADGRPSQELGRRRTRAQEDDRRWRCVVERKGCHIGHDVPIGHLLVAMMRAVWTDKNGKEKAAGVSALDLSVVWADACCAPSEALSRRTRTHRGSPCPPARPGRGSQPAGETRSWSLRRR